MFPLPFPDILFTDGMEPMLTMDFTESNIIPGVDQYSNNPAIDQDTVPECDFSVVDDLVLSAGDFGAEPGFVIPAGVFVSEDADELDTIDEEGRERTDSSVRRRRESRERRERKDSRERKRSLEMMDGLEDVAVKVVDSVIETAVDRVNNEDFKSFEPEFKFETEFKSWGNLLGQEVQPESVTEEFSMIEAVKGEVNGDKYISFKDENGMDSLDTEKSAQAEPEFDSWSRIMEAPTIEFQSDFQIESHSDIEIESRTTFDSDPTTESYSDDEGVVALEEDGVGFSEGASLNNESKEGHPENRAEPYMDDVNVAFSQGDSLHFGTIDIVDEEAAKEDKPDTPRVALDECLPQEPPIAAPSAAEPAPEVMFADVMIERSAAPEGNVDLHWKKDKKKHKYEGELKAEAYIDEDMKVDENFEDHESVVVLAEEPPEVTIAQVTVTSSKPDEHPDVECEPIITSEPIVSEPIVSEPIVSEAAPAVVFADVTITRSAPDAPDSDIHWKKDKKKHKYEGEVKCEPLSKEDLKEAIKDIAKAEPKLNLKSLLFHILAVIISTAILAAFYSDLDENLSLPCVVSCIVYFSLCVYNDCVNGVSSPAYKIWMFDVFSYIVLPLAIGSSILELSEMYLQPEEAVEDDVFIISSIISSILCIIEVVLLKFSVDYKMLPLCVVFPVFSNFFLRRWMAGEEPDILVDI